MQKNPDRQIDRTHRRKQMPGHPLRRSTTAPGHQPHCLSGGHTNRDVLGKGAPRCLPRAILALRNSQKRVCTPPIGPNGGQEPHLVARWLLKTRPFRPFQQKGPPRDYSGFGGNQHQNGSPDWAKGRRDVCRARFWLRATRKKGSVPHQ